MSETKFGTWAPPESAIVVEYSLAVIEEIRQAVADGFQRFARGGIEVGGVLYGTVEESTIRVLAIREIACEHLTGPSFQLSEKDRAAFTEQLVVAQTDTQLEGYQPLGFYVSHTRSEIALQPGEFEIFNERFPGAHQVVMVVRPGRAGRMRAGFFVRETDGGVKADRSHLDFDFPDRLFSPSASQEKRRRDQPAAPPEQTAAPEPVADAEAPPQMSPALPVVEPPDPIRAPEYVPVPQPKKKWLPWVLSIAGVLLVATAAVAGLRYFGTLPAPPVSLSVTDAKSQLNIGWDLTSPTIRTAAKGTLVIVDGNDTLTSKLTPSDFARGSFLYPRHSGDVQVRLEVQTTSHEKRTEMTRFIGAPPLPITNDELEAVKRERDSMREELDRLREQVAKQAAQVKQSERALAIMRTRIGIVSPTSAAKK